MLAELPNDCPVYCGQLHGSPSTWSGRRTSATGQQTPRGHEEARHRREQMLDYLRVTPSVECGPHRIRRGSDQPAVAAPGEGLRRFDRYREFSVRRAGQRGAGVSSSPQRWLSDDLRHHIKRMARKRRHSTNRTWPRYPHSHHERRIAGHGAVGGRRRARCAEAGLAPHPQPGRDPSPGA